MTSPPKMPQSGATLVFMFPDTAQPIDANLDKNKQYTENPDLWAKIRRQYESFYYDNGRVMVSAMLPCCKLTK
ncbi:hypothetical protein M8J76_008793 [Diaphorina citri]|nr:hypothetical protein M8J76_008793 [Diaphorina citri]